MDKNQIIRFFYKYIVPLVFILTGPIIYMSRGHEAFAEALLFPAIGVIYFIGTYLFNKSNSGPDENHSSELDKLVAELQKNPRFSESSTSEGYSEEFQKALDEHKDIIEKSCARIGQIHVVDGQEPGLKESKFGGEPYWPQGMDYPQDNEGQPMALIAQINCNDVPSFLGWPEKGLVQFYLAARDDFYGADLDTPTNNEGFRVIYHENTDAQHVPQELPEDAMLPFDIENPVKITIKEAKILPDIDSVKNVPELEKIADISINNYIDYWFDSLEEMTGSNAHHQIGGYPYIIQNDPREGNFTTLLLQLDSDDHMMWGDNGNAQFFISAENLAKKDFSKILYNWACT